MDLPVTQLDLSTPEGLITMITAHLQPHLIHAFEVGGGYLPMGVALIATRFEGQQLETPRSVVVFASNDEQDAAGFLSRTYHWGARECGALGAVTFGMTWAVAIQKPIDAARWRGRDISQHPKAVEALMCILEHKTFGVRSWISYIADPGQDPLTSAFQPESEEVVAPTAGFLETIRAVS